MKRRQGEAGRSRGRENYNLDTVYEKRIYFNKKGKTHKEKVQMYDLSSCASVIFSLLPGRIKTLVKMHRNIKQ